MLIAVITFQHFTCMYGLLSFNFMLYEVYLHHIAYET